MRGIPIEEMLKGLPSGVNVNSTRRVAIVELEYPIDSHTHTTIFRWLLDEPQMQGARVLQCGSFDKKKNVMCMQLEVPLPDEE